MSAGKMDVNDGGKPLTGISLIDRLGAGAGARCWCHACRPVTPLRHEDMRMVLCPDCGNKRCPKANNHGHACTGSNAQGQPGSAYA